MQKKAFGFTLLEVIMVVTIIGVLATIVIVAINPSKQMAEARNTQRRSDANALQKAIYQYIIETGGMPAGITTTLQDICAPGQSADCVSLSVLTLNQEYLADLPVAPQWTDTGTIGYQIRLSSSGRGVEVTAQNAELGAIISTPPGIEPLSGGGSGGESGLGCMDGEAYNYDPEAVEDDGSCFYNPGCTDPGADNYDAGADGDDGSCYYCVLSAPVITSAEVVEGDNTVTTNFTDANVASTATYFFQARWTDPSDFNEYTSDWSIYMGSAPGATVINPSGISTIYNSVQNATGTEFQISIKGYYQNGCSQFSGWSNTLTWPE